MPVAYQPGAGAQPVPPWSIAILSQRDLALQLPLNFATSPGVSLSSACFAHGVYEVQAAALCFSNLLAIGFRRFVLDLYWDAGRRAWSFCPVELPQVTASNSSSTGSGPNSTEQSSSISITDARITGRHLVVTSAAFSMQSDGVFTDDDSSLPARQAGSSPPNAPETSRRSGSNTSTDQSTSASSISLSSASRSSSTASAPNPSNDATIIRNGPYQCSPEIDFAIFSTVLDGYMRNSSNTLAAAMTYIEFNMHVAAPVASPGSPPAALNSSTAPNNDELLKNSLAVNLSSVLYTPALLRNDRANLNASWLSASLSLRPDASYFDSKLGYGGVLTTDDGWPSESYVEFKKLFRLAAGYRSFDPQLAEYSSSADGDVIFPVGYIASSRTVSYSSAGTLEQGCYFANGITDIAGANNSWALSTDLKLPQPFPAENVTSIASISHLSNCGISPLLNTTLSNLTADVDFKPYQSFAYNTIWSWTFGEPRSVSSSEPNSKLIRCALMDTTLSGRWRVADCTEHHAAACRTNHHPYVWKLSSSRGGYSSGEEGCPDGTTFAAPRSGLENAYLAAVASQRPADAQDGTVWLNLNSLDVEGCWVSGANSTCPYTGPSTANRGRTVVVPIVAAIVVFVIAALTLFVKCAANRRDRKRGRRRRRADDGWEYEGVPS